MSICSTFFHFCHFISFSQRVHGFVGPVVMVAALRVADRGFDSSLCRDFSGLESYQQLKNWHSSGYPARHLVL